jgi:hypothetical protein
MLPGQDGSVTPVVAFVPDLMDRSRIQAALPEVEFVANPAALTDHPAATVIVDLGRAGALEVLPALAGRRTIGFASHVDSALLAAASAAGCTEVMPRSRFFASVAAIVGRPAAPS